MSPQNVESYSRGFGSDAHEVDSTDGIPYKHDHLLSLWDEEGVMDAPVGLQHKVSGKSDFIYLVDDNGLLVDSISWRHAKDSIPFGYERPHPEDDFFALSTDGGSPLDYNSNHRPDSESDAKGSVKRGWVVFFVLFLVLLFVYSWVVYIWF